MKALEQQILSEISLDAPWSLVEEFATAPRWRAEDVNRAVDSLANRLSALGVPVVVHEPTIFLSIPIRAEVQAGGKTFRAKPPSNSRSVPEGLSGPLSYLRSNPKNIRSYSRDLKDLFGDGVGSEEEARALVAGKIVVTESFANPANTSLFESWGARGVIAVNPGEDIHWGTCTTVWGTPDLDDLPRKPKIPAVAVNNPDGQALIELAKTGGSATIVSELEEGWYMQKVPVVDIPGNGAADKFVFVHGHLDSWDVGVGDNATGDATLLELARVLWNNRDKLERSVRVAWWPGHSTGRYAGSTWFSDAFAIDLDENCVAQINCDSPGCRWATSYHQTTVMPEAQELVLGTIKELTGLDAIAKRPHQAGDYSFNNIGISSFFMLSSTMPDALREEKGYYSVSGCGGNIAWHTENDTLEIADKDVLLTDIKIYLLAILRVANADVLPFDWRVTAATLAATADRYQSAARAKFDLTPTLTAIADLSASLSRFYENLQSGGGNAAAANEAIQGLARILVPLDYTREARFRHDPAYSAPSLPTLVVATELDRHSDATLGFAKTQLTRGQNRVVAALRQATRQVEAATR